MQLADRTDWALMIAIHDALRRDLDQLLHATASHASARARWAAFRSQLRFHLAAEHAAMWPRVRPKLSGHPHGQALLDAMDDERQLLGPLQAMIDDAFTMDADPGGSASCWPGWPATSPARKPTRCRSSARSCPPANSAESPQPSAAGTAPGAPGPRSRGPSSAPAPTSVSTH